MSGTRVHEKATLHAHTHVHSLPVANARPYTVGCFPSTATIVADTGGQLTIVKELTKVQMIYSADREGKLLAQLPHNSRNEIPQNVSCKTVFRKKKKRWTERPL